MAHYSKTIREEELKNLVRQDWFKEYDTTHIEGNIDFYVGKGDQCLIWGEAKKGVKKDLYNLFIQLILTIGKAKTVFNAESLPVYLCGFDAEKIGFLLYDSICEVFEMNDFNWNVTPSDKNTKEFKLLYSLLLYQLSKSLFVYDFEKQAESLRYFIRSTFSSGKRKPSKIAVNKNNFPHIYRKWYSEVLNTLAVDWESLKKIGIYEHDFFLADLISEKGKTIPQKLSVLLEDDNYKVVIDKLKTNDIFTNFGFLDGQKAHRQFWQRYKRPPKKEYQDYIIERADRLKPKDVREFHGAFFTPIECVELAQQYIAQTLGDDWQEKYYVWDCAAGTGNLLAGLINTRNLWASTLEKSDVDIMKERIQGGLNLFENHVFQFDFLNDAISDTVDSNGENQKSKVPDDLQAIINDPNERRKLVFFINPPYGEGDNRKGEGRKGIAENTYIWKSFGEDLGYSKRELYIQFLYRIYKQVPGAIIADFSTLKNLQAPKFLDFRKVFEISPISMFIVPAYIFDNVNSDFPIGFKIWDTSIKQHFHQIIADIYEGKKLMPAGKKNIICYDGRNLINDWTNSFRLKGDQKSSIATVIGVGNDFQNQRTVRLERPNRPWNHQFQWQVTSDNLIKSCIYLAVRLIPEANWINDRDQFLEPNDGWQTDEIFQTDCLTYAIFNTKNNLRSSDGPNHWQPFTEKQLGLTNSFQSHFMTDFIEGKIYSNSAPTVFEETVHGKLHFSQKAQAVFEAALPLWRYYFAQKDSNINATYYDIREFFCGRNKNGTMNSKSIDNEYNLLHENLRRAHKDLGNQIEDNIYKYEFLIK